MAAEEEEVLLVMWQLVGDTRVRSTWSVRCARDLKDAVGRELGIAPQWLEVSWRAHRLANDDGVPAVAVAEDCDPVLVSLVLPRFARPCSEACTPRSKRHRVTNQAAVSALVWQPGLHRHELGDEEEGGESSAHRQAAPSYPVFVSGIAGFPAPLLRLDLGCETPTVATLRKLLLQVTGIDYNLSFGGRPLLGSARQYLKRLCIFAGSVVAVEGWRPALSASSPASSTADASIDTPPILSALVVELAALSDNVHCIQDASSSSVSVGKRSLTAVLLPQQPGALWSGSSRKRMLSTGHTAPRGPNAGVSIDVILLS